ncbi:cytochrome-c peroxidase [Spongiibacter marinus]|uniref:cytochrome-c peroxidase n=1 Tax=Spongiibacter marinus TaxID=354246 RepID=UPI0030B7FE17|nr:cytochrome c peroxidase [Spongiibacter marinus]
MLNNSVKNTLAVVGLCLGGLATSATANADAALRAQAQAFFKPLPAAMPGSENDTPERIALGEQLYFETALSTNGSQSCNSCHQVDNNGAGVDNEPTSPGALGERGGRNSPTSFNAGFHIAQFWDGRAADLKAQAKGPILNPVEMAMPDEATAEQRLRDAGYATAFAKAFPNAEPALSYDNMAEAIAAFERTLITRDRFDEFLAGDDQALNAAEKQGLKTFISTGCIACHSGATLGGTMYQKMGVVNAYANTSDIGRQEVTGKASDRFVFKVPALRDISRTAPYFHDGAAKTLDEAVKQMAWLQLGRSLSDADTASIVTFLNALENTRPVTLSSVK